MAYSPTAVLKKLIEERVLDIRLTGSRTLSYLNATGRVMAGTQDDFYWNVVTSGSTVVGASMDTAGVNQAVGDTVQARLSIGANKFYHQFSLKRTDMQNASAAGTGKLKQLFKTHIDSGILALRRRVNQAIWTGDGTAANGGMIGLQQALATGAYAGIDPVANPLWAPVLATAGAPRALTRTLLYDLTRLQGEQEVASDVYFINPSMGQTYQTLFDNIAGAYSIAGVTNTERNVDLGYNVMSYQGQPILTDPMAPAGQFIGFNTNDISLITYDLAGADKGELSALGQKDNFDTITSADVEGMRVNVALLPESNPGQITFQMFVLPQLKVANRRSLQGITNLL